MISIKKNVLEGYTTLWWKTTLTDGCKRSLMHLSLRILLRMAKIEIFHRQRPPWPSLYLSTGLEDRRSHWHVLMHSFSCQDAQNICDDKMWCWMYTEAGMTLQCPGFGGRGCSPLIRRCRAEVVAKQAKHSFSDPGARRCRRPFWKSFRVLGFSRFSGSGVDKKRVKFEDAFWKS